MWLPNLIFVVARLACHPYRLVWPRLYVRSKHLSAIFFFFLKKKKKWTWASGEYVKLFLTLDRVESPMSKIVFTYWIKNISDCLMTNWNRIYWPLTILAGDCLVQVYLHVKSVWKTCKWLLKAGCYLTEVATYTGATVFLLMSHRLR